MRENGTRTFQIDGSSSAQAWGMSSDGSRVFFTTSSALVSEDTDGGLPDLYMFDRNEPDGSRLRLLSVDGGNPNASVLSVVEASGDGQSVYFVADGLLAPGEPADVLTGLYRWHDGQITYIGRFEDLGDVIHNSPHSAWDLATATRTSRVTPDGRFLLFMLQREGGFVGQGGYTGYDHGTACGDPCRELYIYSADDGSLRCVSCNPLARVATGNALTDVHEGSSGSPPVQHLSRALSDDGRHVFFSSPEALVPEDSNGKWDAYEYDVPSATLHLISSGTGAADSYFMDASPDGHNVFFATRDRLVGWDVDDNYDLYDARVDGGFPEPAPAAIPCAGDTCRGPADAAPAVAAGASTQFRGSGNVHERLREPKTQKRCKGRAVLKRVRGKRKCVNRRSHRRAKRSHARAERSGR